MKSKRIVLITIILAAGACLWWWLSHYPQPKAASEAAPAKLAPMPKVASSNEPPIVVPPPRTENKEELHQWWLKMSKIDRNFEWKMPIEFYGKVVDEQGMAVEGAEIGFQWNNYSATGSAESNTRSDPNGLFSLKGVTGKSLGVSVKKEGYKRYYNGNQFSFEYAAYFEPQWHVPNASNPVIFKMHKNREADPLVVRENQEAELSPGQKRSFNIGPKGAAVVVERLPNVDNSLKGWAARISVPGGGLVISTAEFPIEAPETGYIETIEVTDKTAKPVVWQGDNGAAFFVKTSQGYGRVTVRNTPGAAWVYVTSYFNPNPNSRNLEFDPAKVIKPAP